MTVRGAPSTQDMRHVPAGVLTMGSAADFPDKWYVEPKLASKMNGLYPDSPAMAQADAEKRFYRPR